MVNKSESVKNFEFIETFQDFQDNKNFRNRNF